MKKLMKTMVTSQQTMVRIRIKSTVRLTMLLIFCALFMILMGCNRFSSEEVVRGVYLIEDISIDSYNVMDELGINSFLLKDDGTCEIPFLDEEDLTWEFLKRPDSYAMKFMTPNKEFEVEFNVEFSVKDGHILQMELLSNTIYVLCSKMLFDAENHVKIVQELTNPSLHFKSN